MKTHTTGEDDRRLPLCEFCNERTVVVYCKADDAKLCLVCDHQVHSANALSLKHLRSPISDDRSNPAESFYGLPSALHVASIWGLDLNPSQSHTELYDGGGDGGFDSFWMDSKSELMVPGEDPGTFYNLYTNPNYDQCRLLPDRDGLEDVDGVGFSSSCHLEGSGKRRSQDPEVLKQLLELRKLELLEASGGDGDEEEADNSVVPRTPSQVTWELQGGGGGGGGGGGSNLEEENHAFLNHHHHHHHHQNAAWIHTSNQINQPTQIWDFHLGQTRHQEESRHFELGFGGPDAGFMINNSSSFMKDKSFGDLLHEENIDYNNDHHTISQGTTTSESNNLPMTQSSSDSAFGKLRNYGASQDVQFMEHSLLGQVDSMNMAAASKANTKMLAQNRGNAMKRYQEKKKTRRYEKHIRYESRKFRADTRMRVKGRFVKATDAPDS